MCSPLRNSGPVPGHGGRDRWSYWGVPGDDSLPLLVSQEMNPGALMS